MKVLVIFSNPPGQTPLRLDREDRAIAQLARQYADTVTVERQHASEIDDVHALICDGGFDVIQFSGHGDARGLYLDRSDLKSDVGEIVSSRRLLSLLECADKNPLLVVLLCCYSDDALEVLSAAAPFVLTCRSDVQDAACLQFVQGFYERLFRGQPVQTSFDQARHLLEARGLPADAFRLSRRCLLKRSGGLFVECRPDPAHDSILVNLDAVADRLGAFGIPEEDLCHQLGRKLRIHWWIFDGVREQALIPIGRTLFGQFTWENARDVVYCTKLMRLRSDVPRQQWELWTRVLTSYNDLASCEYRRRRGLREPAQRPVLEEAVRMFQHHLNKYLLPTRDALEKLGQHEDLLPHIEFALAETERAADHLEMNRPKEVVIALETALTNYHAVADGLQPPEEDTPSAAKAGGQP